MVEGTSGLKRFLPAVLEDGFGIWEDGRAGGREGDREGGDDHQTRASGRYVCRVHMGFARK